LLLLDIALIATYLPPRRAVKIDLIAVLREA
jgi:ABC-type lipoprotein release transport system permease subunit